MKLKLKLEGASRPYTPKDTDEVKCIVHHGVTTTWGALDAIQRLAVKEGIDTVSEHRCILVDQDCPSALLEDEP
jgi:hypothetical protein